MSLAGEKDRAGYLTTSSERYATTTSALVSHNLDLDLDGAEELFEAHLGKVRLKVDPRSDEPVFVGIARTSDVRSYLGWIVLGGGIVLVLAAGGLFVVAIRARR